MLECVGPQRSSSENWSAVVFKIQSEGPYLHYRLRECPTVQWGRAIDRWRTLVSAMILRSELLANMLCICLPTSSLNERWLKPDHKQKFSSFKIFHWVIRQVLIFVNVFAQTLLSLLGQNLSQNLVTLSTKSQSITHFAHANCLDI